jgi:hypothetical protein
MKRWLQLVALGVVFGLTSSRVSLGVHLEFDRTGETASASLSASAFAGPVSDSNSAQYSGVEILSGGAQLCVIAGGEGGAMTCPCLGVGNGPPTLPPWWLEEDVLPSRTSLGVEFFLDGTSYPSANASAGFSSRVQGKMTLRVRLVPDREQEEETGASMTLKFSLPYSVIDSVHPLVPSTNVSAQAVCKWDLSVGENKFGPYELRYKCCPVESYSNIPDPRVPITVTAGVGDVIELSLVIDASNSTVDPKKPSACSGPLIVVGFVAAVKSTALTFQGNRKVRS